MPGRRALGDGGPRRPRGVDDDSDDDRRQLSRDIAALPGGRALAVDAATDGR